MQKVKIVTHSGGFHADDVLAVATLKLMLGKDFDVEVIRSRDPEDWQGGDYVVDVGGIYDPGKQRFDHHQEGGAGGRENGIEYSSFGLVWKHYGEVVSGSAEVARRIDVRLVQGIDAIDNGQVISTPLYKELRQFTIGDYISYFNPSWKDSGRDHLKSFLEAVDFGMKFLERLINEFRGEVEGENIIREQIKSSPNPQVAEIDHNLPYIPVSMEFPNLLYLIYQDDSKSWRIKAVRKSLDSFEYRKFLPASWAGKTGEELAKISGVSDATFCHRHLFTAGATTKEGILKMAEIALSE